MKKSVLVRFLCLMLTLFAVVQLAACNNNDNPPQPEQTQPPTSSSSRPTTFVPDADYAIVYGQYYSSNKQIENACKYLKRALEAAYGISVSIVDDVTEINAKKEFLVGMTNRAASDEIESTLSLNDYTYYVSSNEAIVLCGGIPEHTYTAVKKFCQDILTYDGEAVTTTSPAIRVRARYNHYEDYEYDTVTINGVLWEDYTLAISGARDMAGAIEINKQFGQYTGYILPIVHVSELTGKEGSIFRSGSAYRAGKASDSLSGYTINTYADDAGNVFCMEAISDKNYETALKEIVEDAELKVEGRNVNYTLTHETVTRINLSSTKSEYTNWVVAEETTKTISDGVTYTETLYYDQNNLPYRVYTLVVDTKINTIAMGCSNDGYDYTVSTANRQTTRQHMEAAVKNGKNVIAGINADFFNIDGNYCPWGLTIKDGKLISKGTLATRPKLTTDNIRPFFGFTKDGQPVVAMESEYATDEQLATLQTAVGGAWILNEDGHTVYNKAQGGVTHGGVHPRAVAGYREDGTVILMVIDGRQPEHSNGASLLQCSMLMQRFGASDSVLLDGGGSSCMVLRDTKTGAYTTVDKPSDGNLRKIYNSLLVIQK